MNLRIFALLTVFFIVISIVESCNFGHSSAGSSGSGSGSSSSSGSSTSAGKKWKWKCGKYKFRGKRTVKIDGTFSGEGDWYVDGKIVWSGTMTGSWIKATRKFKMVCGSWKCDGEGDESGETMSGSSSIADASGAVVFTGSYSAEIVVVTTKTYECKVGEWKFKGEGEQEADGSFSGTGTLTDASGAVVYSGKCGGTYTESSKDFKINCGEYEFNGSGGQGTVTLSGTVTFSGTATATATTSSSSSSSGASTYEFKSGTWVFKGELTVNADGTYTGTGTLTDGATGEVVYSGDVTGKYDESSKDFECTCGTDYVFAGSGGEGTGTATVKKGGAEIYSGTFTVVVTASSSSGSSSSGASTYEFKSGTWAFKGELTINADGTYTGTGTLTDGATGEVVYSGDVTGKYDESTKDFECTCGTDYVFAGSGGEGTGTATVKKGGAEIYSGTFTVVVTASSSSGGGDSFTLKIGDWTFEGTGTKNADGTFTANGKCMDASGAVVYEGDISGTMDESTGDLTATAGTYTFSYANGEYTIKNGETVEYTYTGTFTFTSTSSSGSSGGDSFTLKIGDWTFEGTGTKNADGSFTANGKCMDASGAVVYEGDISGTMDESTGDLTATAGTYTFSYANGEYTIKNGETVEYTYTGTFTFTSTSSSGNSGGDSFTLKIGDWTFEGTGTKNADGSFTANGKCMDASGAVVYEGDISGTMDESTGDLTATAGTYTFSYANGEYTIKNGETVEYTYTGTFTFTSTSSSGSSGGDPFTITIGDWKFVGTGTKNADGSFTANGDCTDASGTVVYSGDITGTMDESTGDLTATAGEYAFSYSGGQYTIKKGTVVEYTWTGTFTFSSTSTSTTTGAWSITVSQWSFSGTGETKDDGTFTADGELKDNLGAVVYTGALTGSVVATGTGAFQATAGGYTFTGTGTLNADKTITGTCSIQLSGNVVQVASDFVTAAAAANVNTATATVTLTVTNGDSYTFTGTGQVNSDGTFSATGTLTKTVAGVPATLFDGAITGTVDAQGVFQASAGSDWTFSGTGTQAADGSISGTCTVNQSLVEVLTGDFTVTQAAASAKRRKRFAGAPK